MKRFIIWIVIPSLLMTFVYRFGYDAGLTVGYEKAKTEIKSVKARPKKKMLRGKPRPAPSVLETPEISLPILSTPVPDRGRPKIGLPPTHPEDCGCNH